MKTFEKKFEFSTKGDGSIVDITGYLRETVTASGVLTGQLSVIVPGSTAAITTMEYEPGLAGDLPEFLESIIPSNVTYRHDATWGDGNGFSHLRSTLIGPSMTIPISGGQPVLGTWQQVVFLEFDNKPRNRRIHLNVIGE